MSKRNIVPLAIALLAIPVRVWPQGSKGAIAGFVRDSTGGAIPGASVTVVGEQTGVAVSVKTQADGAYLVPQLAPATYRVSGESDGFKKLFIEGLKVDVGTTLTQDLVLEIGVATESIQVTGQTSLVETMSGEVGSTVQVAHVLEMPLVDRNVFNLVNLVPGSFSSGGDVSIGGGPAAIGCGDGGRRQQYPRRIGRDQHRAFAPG